MEIALGIWLIILAVVLVTFVLLQSGKDKKLSSAITGSADNFFSKGKSKSKDKILSRITTVLSVLFVALTLVAVIVIAALN